jgi:hypothetical protein
VSFMHFYAPGVHVDVLNLESRSLLAILGVPLLVLCEEEMPPWQLLRSYEDFPLSLVINVSHQGFQELARDKVQAIYFDLSRRYVPLRYQYNYRAMGEVFEMPRFSSILETMFYSTN